MGLESNQPEALNMIHDHEVCFPEWYFFVVQVPDYSTTKIIEMMFSVTTLIIRAINTSLSS
jgi:hypothetical protein